jgi:hypothetical protein
MEKTIAKTVDNNATVEKASVRVRVFSLFISISFRLCEKND